MNPGMLAFAKLREFILKDMSSKGVNTPLSMKIAKHYNDKAKKTGLTGIAAADKAIELFKADSDSNKMKVMQDAKNAPKKARKSKKSKHTDSDSE